MCECSRPAAVSQRMHRDPDPSLPLVQLQRARSVRETKVPVATPRVPSQFALAPNDEASLTALGESPTSGEHEIQLQHVCWPIVIWLRACSKCIAEHWRADGFL